MASSGTGFQPAPRRDRVEGLWTRLREEDPLTFAMAVQGLALVLFAFFAASSSPNSFSTGAPAASLAAGTDAPVPSDWQPELPADLLPQRLPLPNAFEPEEPSTKRQPVPEPEGPEDTVDERSEGLQSRLAALRVDSVSYHAPVAVNVALGAPEAPARLSPGTISLAGFRRGSSKPARRGFGGRGIDGSGIGIGGFGIGGGECSRGPGRFPGIVERTHRIVPE